jgi:hypothetical protein
VQPLALGVDTVRLVAASPPSLVVLPCALTHLFKTRAAEVAVVVAVYFVDEPMVIVLVEAVPVCEVTATVITLAVTAVTLPETGVAPAPPGAPPVVPPPVPLPLGAPVGAPEGRVPPVVPVGRVPPPPKPVVHLPAELAAVIAIVVAAVVDVVLLAVAPPANDDTQEPTVTAAAVALAVSLMVVADV